MKSAEDKDFDASRRTFLTKGAQLALGLLLSGTVVGRAVRLLGVPCAAVASTVAVLPPGALDTSRFERACIGCLLCASNCPTNIIKPSAYGLGPVHVDYAESGCAYDCTICNALCPTGALKPLSLDDKQWLRVGEAVFYASHCRVTSENVSCDLCANICPKGAIYMDEWENGLKVPAVNAFHCIGCGACQAACPTRPKAISVRGTEQEMM